MRPKNAIRQLLAPATIVVRVVATGIVVAGCGWMVWDLAGDDRLRGLYSGALDVPMLAASVGLCAASQLLYFARWPRLARTLGVPLGWIEAVLAAATAQLLGSLAFGAAAADMFRAVTNATRCAGHRVGLVASILADRLSGLYALVCLAAAAGSLTPAGSAEWNAIRAASLPLLWLAMVAGGGCFLLGLLVNLGPVLELTRRVPLVHALVVRVLSAIERFRAAPAALMYSIVAGVVVHALNSGSMWLLAGGLSLPRPSLAAHCLILPLAACTGLLPLPLAGLGAVEMIVDTLYTAANPEAHGAGLIVSLTLRIMSLAVNGLLVAALAVASRIWPAIDVTADVVS